MLTRHHHHGSRPSGHFSLPYYSIIAATFILFFPTGCSLLRPRERVVTVTTTVTEYRDSTAWRDTTIYVPIPLEANQAIVQVGDTSHCETSVAESDAWVGPDGFLHHNIRNKAGARIPYSVKLPERWLYTGVTNTRERAEIIPKEVKVERPLNAWQRFRIGAFWWLLGLAAVGWRKQLLWLIKKAAGLFG